MVATLDASATYNILYTCINALIGTPLGDPIEVGALGHALRGEEGINQSSEKTIDLVSVKSHFGHTEGAAGLTGALLAIHCLDQHRRPAVRTPNH